MAPVTKKWSVLVYFAADVTSRRMREAALANLGQLGRMGSNGDVYVAAQIDLKGQKTRRYIFPQNPDGESWLQNALVEEFPNVDSANAEILAEFLQWGGGQCPAEKFAVVLWGHGYGLDDYNPVLPSALNDFILLQDEDSAVQVDNGRHQVPRLSLSGIDDPFFEGGYSMFLDVTSGSYLLNSQVAQVVGDWKGQLPQGQSVGVLGLDCCEMAMLEVWDQMAGCADFGVASQFGIPYTSLPYDRILKQLLSAPQMTPRDLSWASVDCFTNYYNAPNSRTVVTLSACDLSQNNAMELAVKPLAEALTQTCQIDNLRSQIFAARNASLIFDADGYLDLGSFCKQLQALVESPTVHQASEGVLAMLPNYVSRTGFAPLNPKKMISLATGVSVWFPGWIQYPDMEMLEKSESEAYLRQGYDGLNFARATRWDLFLTTILSCTRGTNDKETRMTAENDDKGRWPGKGHVPPKGKITPKGKERIFVGSSSREAGVVVRASVEAFGPVGDTSLTITVNWPAGNVGPIDEGPDDGDDGSEPKPKQEPGTVSNATRQLPPTA
jgi:hypothetical protein